jgi:hypothetical protein
MTLSPKDKERFDEDEYWFKKTGHHALNVSDFGYWSCSACGKRGDDWMAPEDYECVKYELDYQI